MSLTFVVPDIHGRVDLLRETLAAIQAEQPEVTDRTVIFLGDYVDRGGWSRQALEVLMAGPQDGSKWICLKGNHEDIMSALYHGQSSEMPLWLANGGDATLASFGTGADDWAGLVRARAHIDWIDALAFFHVDRHRIYVHAYIDPALPLQSQDEYVVMTKCYPEGSDKGYVDPKGRLLHVVHGHHSDERNPRSWGARTCLDTGAYRHGRIAIGVFDDAVPGGPRYFLTIQGPTLSEARHAIVSESAA